ncbi:hypothetical protein ACNZ70_001711 [Vibrio mimicus]
MKRNKLFFIISLFLASVVFGCAKQTPSQERVIPDNAVKDDISLSHDVDCLTELESIGVKERHKFNRIYRSCKNEGKTIFEQRYIENSYYIGEVYE